MSDNQMRIIDGNSDQLGPFIEALQISPNGLQKVTLEVAVDGVMEVTTVYKSFVEEAGHKKLIDVIKKWGVHVIDDPVTNPK